MITWWKGPFIVHREHELERNRPNSLAFTVIAEKTSQIYAWKVCNSEKSPNPIYRGLTLYLESIHISQWQTLYIWFARARLRETLRKRPTSVAHLTNFSFEFFNEIFTEDASLLFLYHGAKKSKMTKNSNQGGPALSLKKLFPNWDLGIETVLPHACMMSRAFPFLFFFGGGGSRYFPASYCCTFFLAQGIRQSVDVHHLVTLETAHTTRQKTNTSVYVHPDFLAISARQVYSPLLRATVDQFQINVIWYFSLKSSQHPTLDLNVKTFVQTDLLCVSFNSFPFRHWWVLKRTT